MNKRTAATLALCLSMSVASYGQNQASKHSVKGVVLDEKGEPVIGASVKVPGSKNGTVTDIDGNFTLSVANENATVEVTYLGYDAQRVKVSSGKVATVRLTQNSQNLNEVVVVGYGTQKKVNLTGSVASVSSDKLTNRVESNVLSAIQGTVPGVTIISRPGSTPSINFRGRGNLGTSEPLYVIDGVIADATFFQNLDPESIESISFLKDAASSSIYGSRAAYGVVLVTTKQGKKERMSVSYSGMVGVKTPTYLPDLISSSEYAELLNEAMYNRNPTGGKNQAYTAEQIGWFKDGSKPDYYPNTDWMDLTMDKHVATTQHSLNVSGGSDKVQYYLGGGYQYNDSFVRGRNSNRYNFNMSLSSKVNNWLAVNGSAKYIRNQNETNQGVPDFTSFLLVPSTMVAKQSNGEFGSISGGQQATLEFINRNPLRRLSKKDWSKSAFENSLYSVGMDITPLKGLKISASGSYKRYEYKYKSYSAKQDAVNNFESGNPISGTSSDVNKMSMSWSSSSRLQTNLVATYNFNIAQDHSFTLLAGTSYEDNKYESLSGSRKNFPTETLESMGAGSSAPEDISNGASMSNYKLMSYFGRINYSFKDRYLFEANVRTDGSSRFYKSERWLLSPSLSAGRRVSEDEFMMPLTWINILKIRASYGTLGNINNVGNYDYFQLYDKSGNYVFDKVPVEGIAESKPAIRSFTWEKVAIADVCVDLDLFDNHLSVVADYYVKKTSNSLLGYNVPVETGITQAPSQNVGKVKNTGFEMAVTYRN